MLTLDKNGRIYDTRCPLDTIFYEGISVCYTLLDDDITASPRRSATPYSDRTDALVWRDGEYVSADNRVVASPYLDGLVLELTPRASFSDAVSEYGLNLPFNFMGKKNSGGWRNQFLFNSPYMNDESGRIYAYLTKPNGNNLLVCVLGEAQGWKMDYSDYSWAHYFMNFKVFSSYDRAFGAPEVKNKGLRLAILPVSDFDSALNALSIAYGVPVLKCEAGGGQIGDVISLKCFGDADSMVEVSSSGRRTLPYSDTYTLREEGIVELIPQGNGAMGLGATLYAYDSLVSLYKKSMDTVDIEIIKKYTDSNLCEHQCWLSATIRFLLKYAHILTPIEKSTYEKRALAQLDIITEPSEERATPRQTILHTPHESYGAYNVYKSGRVQELFFGITILLDAYKYFGDEKYLRYAIGATDCLIDNYTAENGQIQVRWGDQTEDYSTVCAPMIPLADMARFLEGRDDARAQKYREACTKLALHLYKRGLVFPTEGTASDKAEAEMEDGSISCTALNLLYYCAHIERDTRFLEKAKEILDIHESWIIKSQLCQMNGSTLRWWETQWEGDADGPAICAGHAWSAWRGEADYLYFELTHDTEHLKKAQRTFMCCLSKIHADGRSYANYNPDRINGGGFGTPIIKIANRYASVEDCGISRYLWIRLCNTFLK